MCDCGPEVKIQEYQNQETVDIPPHMGSYRKARREAGLTEKISIDRCILPEIQDLWRVGIHTLGSCCGHNVAYPMINVRKEDDARMLEMGYIRWPVPKEWCRETFFPKTIPVGRGTPTVKKLEDQRDRALDLAVKSQDRAIRLLDEKDASLSPVPGAEDARQAAEALDNMIDAMDKWGGWEDGIPAEFAPVIADARRMRDRLSLLVPAPSNPQERK